MKLLEVNNLTVRFSTSDGEVTAVDELGFSVESGETLGLVGESGSGKSQAVLAIMGLLAGNGEARGSVRFKRHEILNLPEKPLNAIRGAEIAMIFQDPMTSLNPYLRISRQMTEVLQVHRGMGHKAALRESIDMLDAVRIPDAKNRIRRYPHEFSGGMRQRVVIAMALLCKPDLIIADEPTTALDVTVQAQIIALFNELKNGLNTAMIMISHDLGVIAGICDRVSILYAGQVMESASVGDIFYRSKHPYTMGLLKSVSRLDRQPSEALPTIPGNPPNPLHLPEGCPFQPRCEYRVQACQSQRPPLTSINSDHRNACHVEI